MTKQLQKRPSGQGRSDPSRTAGCGAKNGASRMGSPYPVSVTGAISWKRPEMGQDFVTGPCLPGSLPNRNSAPAA